VLLTLVWLRFIPLISAIEDSSLMGDTMTRTTDIALQLAGGGGMKWRSWPGDTA
jgi:hypothetical protein